MLPGKKSRRLREAFWAVEISGALRRGLLGFRSFARGFDHFMYPKTIAASTMSLTATLRGPPQTQDQNEPYIASKSAILSRHTIKALKSKGSSTAVTP